MAGIPSSAVRLKSPPSNEGRRVLPRVTGGLEVPSGRFVTALDGTPVAYSHGHGHAIDWR